MFWRALAAFMILPGTFGFLVPLLIVAPERWRSPAAEGVVLLAAGVVLLLWCVRDFYVRGRGTLAPWSPPQRLVTVGLYRHTRNPMYLAVLTVLLGWALAFRSPALWIYLAFVAAAFHLRVLLNEEPYLARTHGTDWVEYRARVPRWIGLRRRSGPPDGRGTTLST